MIWKSTTVGAAFEFVRNGKSVQQDKSGTGLPITRIETISDWRIDPARVGFAGLDETGNQKWMLQKGDILFSHINSIEHIGKCAIYEGIPSKLIHGMNLLALRPKAGILDPKFAYYALSRNAFRKAQAQFVNKAVNQASISSTNLKLLQFPLPPLDEQRRIAAILDQADDLRRKRRAALEKLEKLQVSLFVGLTGVNGLPAVRVTDGPSQSRQGLRWVKLTDVARLATGHTPDRKIERYWKSGSIPWLTLGDIRALDGAIAYHTNEMITEEGIQNSSAVLLPKDTVCFSRTASVGFSTMMGRPMATSQDFVNWVCGPELVPMYLMWALKVSRPRLLALATGSTHRTIYFPTVEEFRLLLPPIEMQRTFAARVAEIGKLKGHHRAHLAKLDALFASLQHSAFRGEL